MSLVVLHACASVCIRQYCCWYTIGMHSCFFISSIFVAEIAVLHAAQLSQLDGDTSVRQYIGLLPGTSSRHSPMPSSMLRGLNDNPTAGC
jgi:hypothetical protein